MAEAGGAVGAAGILAAVGAFFKPFWDAIVKRAVKRGWQVWSTIWGYFFMVGFHAATRMFPKQAGKLWERIVDTYYTGGGEWAPAIAAYIENMTGEKIEISDITGGAFNISGAIGKAFLYPMLNLVLPGAEIKPGAPPITPAELTPEDGLIGAENFLSANLHFQMSAWLLHVLGDMQSFGMFKSLKDLPNAISWSYGLGWLSWLVMGVPFRMAISDPLERYFNLVYRPMDLPYTDLIDMVEIGEITASDFLTRMREKGYKEDDIAALMILHRHNLSIAERRTLYRRGEIDQDDIANIYLSEGHPKAQAAVLAAAFVEERSDDLIEDIADEALDLYEDDVFDWETTREYLEAAGYTDSEIDLQQTLADLKKLPRTKAETTPRSLTPSQIGARYRDGIIGREEAEALLLAIPYQADQIDLFLAGYEPAEPKVEEPREITRGVVGGLYKRGIIDEKTLRSDLERLGYTDWALERLVSYYAPKVPAPPEEKPPRALPASWVFALHEEGIISTDDAVARLAALRIPEDDATLVLTTLHPQVPVEDQPARVLPTGVVGGLYKSGYLDSDEAISLFVQAGYDLLGAQYLEIYYRPPEEVELLARELRPSEVARLLAQHEITWPEAVDRVHDFFVSEREMTLFFALYTSETLPPIIIADLRSGLIAPDEAIGELTKWFTGREHAVAWLESVM